MDVDTQEHELTVFPCSPEHTHYLQVVGEQALRRKLFEMSSPWKQDIEKMRELLSWRSGTFFRPTFGLAENGLTAFQCFWDWDTKGVTLPKELTEPQLLADLVQAKKCREFQIDQWVETYAKRDEYPILPEEYLEHPGMTPGLFKKLFGRAPNEHILTSIASYSYKK